MSARQQKVAQEAQDRRDGLNAALRLVAREGHAPLARVRHSMPKTYSGQAYNQWMRRQQEIAREVADKLRDEGFVIQQLPTGTNVSFAGIRAVSSMGLARALRNWETAAKKKLRELRR